MTLTAIHVEAWAAVLAVGSDAETQHFGSYVDDSVIPSAHRRRLGSFGRMAVSCGLSVAGADSSDLIFCSRFGDLDLAYRLLEALAKDELLSPAAFSLSVHNAVPGVMDLVRKSRVGHTAISAGPQSLSAGLLEAWAKLADQPDRRVTLVYAEGAVPAELRQDERSDVSNIALALTLTAEPSAYPLAAFHLSEDLSADAEGDLMTSEMLAESLIRLLGSSSGEKEPVTWTSLGLTWSCIVSSNATD